MSDYCQFCLQPLSFTGYSLDCDNCIISYDFINKDSGLITWGSVKISEKNRYSLQFVLNGKITNIYRFVNGNAYGLLEVAMKLPYIVKHVSPNNIKSKIKTLLTFS